VLRRSGAGDLGFGTLVTNNIGDDQCTNAKLAPMAANTMKANATAAVDNPTDVALAAQSILLRAAGNIVNVAAASDEVLRRSGAGDLDFGTIVTGNIGNSQVTLPKLASIADQTVLGNGSGASAAPAALTLNAPFIATAGTVQLQRTVNGHLIIVSNALKWSKSRSYDFWYDEFDAHTHVGSYSSSPSDLLTGTGCWTVTSPSGLGTSAQIASEQNHSGILRIGTGATNGNSLTLYKGGSTVGSVVDGMYRGDEVASLLAILRLPASTTVYFEVGFTDLGPISTITNAIIFYFDTTVDTTVHAYCEEAGTGTDVDTGVAPGTGWNTYEISQDSVGTIEFFIDDVLTNTVSTNVPDAENMTLGLGVLTRANVARTLDIDYVSYESQSLGARTT
jgi:hypothetical protein